MKKKFLAFLVAVVFMLPISFFLSACGENPPEKTLSSISAEAKDPDSTTVEYAPNISQMFDLDDFTITATYSDGSTSEVTQDVTMEASGVFDYIYNSGKFTFTYQEKTADVYIVVTQRSIENDDFVVTGIEDSYNLESIYDVIEPDITLTWNGVTLQEDEDYYVIYGGNNVDFVGEDGGELTVSGQGNYSGQKSFRFDIVGLTSSDNINFSDSEHIYSGENYFYEERILDGIEGVNYVVYEYSTDNGNTWSENVDLVNAGTYKLKARFVMESGYVQIEDKIKTVTISPVNLSNLNYEIYDDYIEFCNRDIVISDFLNDSLFYLYNGDNQYSGTCLEFGTDFVIDTECAGFVNGYKNNRNVTSVENKAQFAIKGVGNYIGNLVIEFNIKPYDVQGDKIKLKSFDAETSTFVFNGTEHQPNIEYYFDMNDNDQYDAGVDIDFTDEEVSVTYQNNVFASESARVTSVFSGNYKDGITEYFTIEPYVLDVSNLVFEEGDLVYNSQRQVIEFTGQSLGALIGGMDADFVKLFHNPSDPSTIKYSIEYSYYGDDDDITDVGTYEASVIFKCLDTSYPTGMYYEDSIVIRKNGEEFRANYDTVFEAEFTISPLEISSVNTIFKFENSDYVNNGSVDYNSEYIDLKTQLIVSLGKGIEDFVYTSYSDYRINAGTYTFSPFLSNEVYSNFIFDRETCGIEDLTFTINKLELNSDNLTTYIQMPTITGYQGEKYDRYLISDFVSKLPENTTYNDKAKFYIVGYDMAENKFEVKLVADNYNMAENLKISRSNRLFSTLEMYDLILMGREGSSDEPTNVTHDFFGLSQLQAGMYYEFYFSEKRMSINTQFKLDEYGSNVTSEHIYDPENQSKIIGCRFSEIKDNGYITFRLGENINHTVVEQKIYLNKPAETVIDEKIDGVYALLYEPSRYSDCSDYYTMYKAEAGDDYDVDYAFNSFKSNSVLLGVYSEGAKDVHTIITVDDLETIGVDEYLGVEAQNKVNAAQLDIHNYKQDTLYLLYYINGTTEQDLTLVQRTIKFDNPVDIGLSVDSALNQHVKIDNSCTNPNGIAIYVDKDYGSDICINTADNVEVWSNEENAYVKANIYVSAKGKLVISAEELTNIDLPSDEETGLNLYTLRLRYTYTFVGITYIVEKDLIIYRETFVYNKYYDPGFYEHQEDIYFISMDHLFKVIVGSKYNYATDAKVNGYGILSMDIMKNDTDLATLEDIQALDLTQAVSIDTNDGIKYNSASLEIYNVNGETRLFLVINYDYTIMKDETTLAERTNCEKIIQLNYAVAEI